MFPFELKAFKNVGNIRKSQTYVKKKVTEKVAYWTMNLVSRSSQFDLKSVNEGAKPQASLICEAVRAHLIEKRRLKNNRASRGRFGNKARPLQGYESGREKKIIVSIGAAALAVQAEEAQWVEKPLVESDPNFPLIRTSFLWNFQGFMSKKLHGNFP